MTTLRPEKSNRSFTAIAFAFILFSVTLRCERSEPRRATARAPRPYPSRAASRPPQDDGKHSRWPCGALGVFLGGVPIRLVRRLAWLEAEHVLEALGVCRPDLRIDNARHRLAVER